MPETHPAPIKWELSHPFPVKHGEAVARIPVHQGPVGGISEVWVSTLLHPKNPIPKLWPSGDHQA